MFQGSRKTTNLSLKEIDVKDSLYHIYSPQRIFHAIVVVVVGKKYVFLTFSNYIVKCGKVIQMRENIQRAFLWIEYFPLTKMKSQVKIFAHAMRFLLQYLCGILNFISLFGCSENASLQVIRVVVVDTKFNFIMF